MIFYLELLELLDFQRRQKEDSGISVANQQNNITRYKDAIKRILWICNYID